MASLANDPGGRRRILFVDTDGNRKTIRLGKMSKRQAEAVKLRIEDLAAAKLSSGTPSDETARWLSSIDSILHDKLSAVGLVEVRERIVCPTLREFTEGVRDAKANLKPNTIRNYDQTIRRLVSYFGEDCKIDSISCGDADQWPEKMLKDGLAPATVGRDVKRARQFFRVAVRRKLIPENPFTEVPAPAQVNTSRGYYVTREVIEKVLAACPDNEWRLIVALSRFGGLRCPSEHQALRWGDIDWENGRINVPSPKTEHLPNGAYRTIPLFAELRPLLEEAFDQAEQGSLYVINRYRGRNQNLRTQFQRILRRAGVPAWERLFHNMRASRETELTEDYPLHVVCSWIGNTAAIAAKHYLQVTDAHFAKAACTPPKQGGAECGALPAEKGAQNAAQPSVASDRTATTKTKKARQNRAKMHSSAITLMGGQVSTVPPRGVEPLSPP